MREKIDFQNMMKEIAEDEQVSRAKPVLLSQQEIAELVKERAPRAAGKGHHEHV